MIIVVKSFKLKDTINSRGIKHIVIVVTIKKTKTNYLFGNSNTESDDNDLDNGESSGQ
jgi:hypothetical protein